MATPLDKTPTQEMIDNFELGCHNKDQDKRVPVHTKQKIHDRFAPVMDQYAGNVWANEKDQVLALARIAGHFAVIFSGTDQEVDWRPARLGLKEVQSECWSLRREMKAAGKYCRGIDLDHD